MCFQMCPQIACMRRDIITLVAFKSHLIIKMILASTNTHHFHEYDASSCAASIQLTKKGKIEGMTFSNQRCGLNVFLPNLVSELVYLIEVI